MISLLHPSRGRPEKALSTFKSWQEKSYAWQQQRGPGYEHLIVVDESDPKLREYMKLFPGLHINKHDTVVTATNLAAGYSRGDLLVYLSDDFVCPNEWDSLIIDEFRGIDKPMLLKVDDCLQRFTTAVLTIPIMNRALFKRLGYFFNPLYKSMHVDEDLYWTARKLEALKYAPHLKFPHEHYSNGKAPVDDTYKRSEANWDQGKSTFERRKREGFPI